MNARFAAAALMLGNLLVGSAVLAPAGMLNELSSDLAVSIRAAGLLIAFGAVVLCFGSPLMTWATSTMDRRILLGATVAVLVVGHVASALAPSYAVLLAVRVVMLAVAAVYTPLAASTIALIVAEKDRPGYIAFVFLGWSLALAGGLPAVAFVTGLFGWRAAFGLIAAFAAINLILLVAALRAGLRGAPISLRSWKDVARNRLIVLLLLVTMLWTAGLYIVFPYLGPLLARLAGAGVREVTVFFALIGVMALVGNIIATRLVGSLGAFRTLLVALSIMLAGTVIWTLGAGSLAAMAVGMVLWGLGSTATPSMVQARLIAVSPALASAAVSLHTSWLYVGQALGAWLGGELIARELPMAMSVGAVVFVAAALAVAGLTRERGAA